MNPDIVIKADQFGVQFPSTDRPTLSKIDLQIHRGEVTLLMGPSGCGKSVLLYCMNAVVPDIFDARIEGELSVLGKKVLERHVSEMGRHVGMVFQDPESQFAMLDVQSDVAFGLENLALDRDEMRSRIRKTVDLMGLQAIEKKAVWQLSGGQKEKVVFASILAMEPEILLLDDPCANLDPTTTNAIFQIVKTMRERGVTVVMVEHKVDEFIELVDRVVIMDDGRTVLDGSPREIFEKHGSRIKRELGLWIPQMSELELEKRKKRNAAGFFPLTVKEALGVFARYDYLAGKFVRKAPQAQELVVDVEDLQFYYPDGTHALKGANLKVRKGSITALLGANGSGKTTLALHLIGILKPSSGRGIVCGMDIKKTPAKELTKRVSQVFQNPEHQFIKTTVFDEMAFSLHTMKADERTIKDRVDELLSMLGLGGLQDRHPASLSGGQKRRLSVAVMMIMNPDLLILDEPTYGQDEKNTRLMLDFFRDRVRQLGSTVLMITHDMKVVIEYAEEVAVMSGGTTIYSGTPEDLFLKQEILEKANLSQPPLSRLVVDLNALGKGISPGIRSIDDFVGLIK